MRCFFMKNGHIADVELLDVAPDEEALNQAVALYEDRIDRFDGFEVWERARKVAVFPERTDDQSVGRTRVNPEIRLSGVTSGRIDGLDLKPSNDE